MLIGEIYLPVTQLVQYYGKSLDEAQLPFNFQFVTLPDWNANAISQVVDAYEAALPTGAWPNWVVGNHDKTRIATRVGPAQARVAHMLLLTLRGTPTCYYGDEIGMHNIPIPPALLQDPKSKEEFPELSRDYQRTPMQWDSNANAGFTSQGVQPWLPIAEDYPTHNVEIEQHDPRSFLSFMHTLLSLRQASPALTIGSYQVIDQDNGACFVYIRQYAAQRYLVALNISPQEQLLRISQQGNASVILSTMMDRQGPVALASFQLRPNEACLIELV